MASTETNVPKPDDNEPIKALFDLASRWATVWAFIALCLWLEHQVLNRLDIESNIIQAAILAASTPVIFWKTLGRIKSDPKAALIVERARYVVILATAVSLGAYLHANHKDSSYESHRREGAVRACAKIAACKESAAQYANNH